MTQTKKFGKFLVFCAVAVAVIASCFLFGCTDKDPIQADENTVVITADSKDFDFEGKFLIDYLNFLKEKDKLSFESQDGQYGAFITTVNGKKAESNGYWAFYTNDTENVNETQTLEYDGKNYSYALLGVGNFPVKKGFVYILHYETF